MDTDESDLDHMGGHTLEDAQRDTEADSEREREEVHDPLIPVPPPLPPRPLVEVDHPDEPPVV
jgi:hypothetical protein